MIDREKVVHRLENQLDDLQKYADNDQPLTLTQDQAKDILNLLKEQEAVRPRRIDGKRNHFIKCGNCNYDLMAGLKFCPYCGQKVKWE